MDQEIQTRILTELGVLNERTRDTSETVRRIEAKQSTDSERLGVLESSFAESSKTVEKNSEKIAEIEKSFTTLTAEVKATNERAITWSWARGVIVPVGTSIATAIIVAWVLLSLGLN